MRIVFLYFSVVLYFLFSNGEPMVEINSPKTNVTKNETEFNNVIQNISRVNELLEELIRNYETVKSLYKSQESVDISSDGEIDELFKQQRARQDKDDNIDTTRNPDRPATPYFYSEERLSDQNDNYTSTNENKESSDEESKEHKFSFETNRNIRANVTSKYLNTNKHSDKTADLTLKQTRYPKVEYVLMSKRNGTKNVTEKVLKKVLPDRVIYYKVKPTTSHTKKLTQNTVVKTKDVKQNQQLATNESESSTSESDSEFECSSSDTDDNTTETKTQVIPKENTSYIKQVIRSEKFSSWNELASKPLKIKTETEQVFKQTARNFKNDVLLRRSTNKTDSRLLQPPRKRKSQKKNGLKAKKVKGSRSPESLEHDKSIMKELFKTRILRKAYGDACLKVVVKKCYKAGKKALKDLCKSDYKCKGKFKNIFDEFLKRGCIKEFETSNGIQLEERNGDTICDIMHKQGRECPFKNKTTPIPDVWKKPAFKTESIDDMIDKHFQDITRSGYLAAACLPDSKPSAQNDKLSKTEVQLNILRDRFERECKKASRGKCTNACKWAVRQTCQAYECKDSRKEKFEKKCKNKCKDQYSSYGGGGSKDSDDSKDSDSGSSGSSSSGSDDSSRSDSSGNSDSYEPTTKTTNKPHLIIVTAKTNGDKRGKMKIATKKTQRNKAVSAEMSIEFPSSIKILSKNKEISKKENMIQATSTTVQSAYAKTIVPIQPSSVSPLVKMATPQQVLSLPLVPKLPGQLRSVARDKDAPHLTDTLKTKEPIFESSHTKRQF